MVQPQKLVMAMDMEKKNDDKKTGFVFNSASGIVQFILTAVLIFLCIPIFIHKLGNVSFGVFSTVAIIGNLSLFANLALDAALIKFLAEQGKTKESNYDICVSLSIILSILIPISILAYIFKDFILIKIFNIPDVFLDDASVLMTCFLITNALLLSGRIFSAILDSQHKVYLSNIGMLIYNGLYWGGILSVILLGYGLKEIGWAILFASGIWFVVITILTFREWGKLDLSGLRNNFRIILKKQLTYTSKIYAGSLLGMLFEPLTKILITNFAGGAVMVGYYEIGVRVRSQIVSLFFKLLYPLYPIVAHVQSRERVQSLVNKVTYALFFLVLPVIVMILFGSESFLMLWIGEENVTRFTIVSVIIITNSSLLFSLPVIPIYYYLRAKNHPGKEVYVQALNVVVNAGVMLMFYKNWGFYAALLGNLVATVASFFLCLYYQHRYLNFNLIRSVKGVGKFVLYSVSIVGVAVIIQMLFPNGGAIYLLVLGIGISVVTLLMGYLLRILVRDNINVIRYL